MQLADNIWLEFLPLNQKTEILCFRGWDAISYDPDPAARGENIKAPLCQKWVILLNNHETNIINPFQWPHRHDAGKKWIKKISSTELDGE